MTHARVTDPWPHFRANKLWCPYLGSNRSIGWWEVERERTSRLGNRRTSYVSWLFSHIVGTGWLVAMSFGSISRSLVVMRNEWMNTITVYDLRFCWNDWRPSEPTRRQSVPLPIIIQSHCLLFANWWWMFAESRGVQFVPACYNMLARVESHDTERVAVTFKQQQRWAVASRCVQAQLRHTCIAWLARALQRIYPASLAKNWFTARPCAPAKLVPSHVRMCF